VQLLARRDALFRSKQLSSGKGLPIRQVGEGGAMQDYVRCWSERQHTGVACQRALPGRMQPIKIVA
jgi:hypothetical protein